MGQIITASTQGFEVETSQGPVTIVTNEVRALYLTQRAEAVADHNKKAKAALARGDMAAFHTHATLYHRAASEHDAVTGGSIRDQYV